MAFRLKLLYYSSVMCDSSPFVPDSVWDSDSKVHDSVSDSDSGPVT